MEDEMVKRTGKLDIEASLSNLSTVIGFIEEQIGCLKMSEKEHSQILIVVEELFVNIVSYAYEPDTGMVSIITEISEDENSFEVTFIDSGMVFNPLNNKDPDITQKAKERKQGGLGIFFAKKKVDSMTYSYEEGKNKLKIKKVFSTE